MASAPDDDGRVKVAVEFALEIVPQCDHAGITINDRREGLITRASSDDVVCRANALQQELGEGPCLDVMRDQDTLVSPDLTQEQRWPSWAPRVHDDLGVGSMMSLLMFTNRLSFGALSLYARSGHQFDADDLAMGQALASVVAVILTAEREIDHLNLGMYNRLTIGQAQGIVMERLDVTPEQAFDYLRRVSSFTNRKVIDLAGDIVATRRLPDID
jgi:GAF domain-containing protein